MEAQAADMIIVKTPGGENCEYNDGVPPGLFAISRAEWGKLSEKVLSSKQAETENDCSNGGHGCVLHIDFKQIIADSEIVEQNANSIILDFVRKAGDASMLWELRHWAEEEKPKIYLLVAASDIKLAGSTAFTTYEAARKAAEKEHGYCGIDFIHEIEFDSVDDKSEEASGDS